MCVSMCVCHMGECVSWSHVVCVVRVTIITNSEYIKTTTSSPFLSALLTSAPMSRSAATVPGVLTWQARVSAVSLSSCSLTAFTCKWRGDRSRTTAPASVLQQAANISAFLPRKPRAATSAPRSSSRETVSDLPYRAARWIAALPGGMDRAVSGEWRDLLST
jgi:hypothetical protein